MDRFRSERLIVVGEDGLLAGIVTPRDLLRVYLRSADEIRAEIADEVLTGFHTNPVPVNVTVADGVVTLDGVVEKRRMIPLVVRMTHAVDGVVDVVDRLSFAVDDTLRDCPAAGENLIDEGAGRHYYRGGHDRSVDGSAGGAHRAWAHPE